MATSILSSHNNALMRALALFACLTSFWLLLAMTSARAQSVNDGYAGQLSGAVAALLLLVAGGFTQVNGQVPPRFARLRADGGIDPDFFGPWLNGPAVRAMALQTDGKILLGGSFTASDSLPRNRLARLQANGPLDTDFEADANAEVLGVAVQADGKILVGGQFTEIAGHAVAYIWRA